jgi:hypothetical protein
MHSREQRNLIISAYSKWIKEQIEVGRMPYYLSFMFSHISGRKSEKMDVMVAQVTRVHNILTRHVVRDREAVMWRRLRPIFIGCHDLPVWKHKRKESLRNLVVNNGLHFNAVALVQPPARTDIPMKTQFLLLGRQSRLNVPLDEHFRDNQRFYVNDILDRIHVTPITRGTMMDYTLKTFKHGRVSADSIQIWN